MSELKIGIIGGTGLGEILPAASARHQHHPSTPFGSPSDTILQTDWAGIPVFLLSRHGPGHLLPPSQVPYRTNIFALKQLGCTHVIATGAVGSLREEFKPGDLVIADQIIDKTRNRAASFYEKAAVHVEFAEPFCPVLRQMLIEAAKREDGGLKMEDGKDLTSQSSPPSSILHPPSSTPYTVHDHGCYVAMDGPAFSTRAESLMHRLWGGDLIGMTAMPEARLAREAEMSYALVALVTDYDSWKPKPAAKDKPAEPPDPAALLKEIRANLQTASDRAIGLIRKMIESAALRREALLAAPAQEALKMAIWSDRNKIAAEEIERLRPLWGRYFQASRQ
jgi:5'-methylthioadenosine phosphorylase